MGHLLIHELRNEAHNAVTYHLIVPPICAIELVDYPFQQQLANLGHLGVDHGDQRRVHVGKVGRGALRLHQRAHEQSAPTDYILAQQVDDDRLDIGDVDLIHQAVDRLFQRLPCHALILLGRLILGLLHHLRELVGWHVQATSLACRRVDDARGRLGCSFEWVLDRLARTRHLHLRPTRPVRCRRSRDGAVASCTCEDLGVCTREARTFVFVPPATAAVRIPPLTLVAPPVALMVAPTTLVFPPVALVLAAPAPLVLAFIVVSATAVGAPLVLISPPIVRAASRAASRATASSAPARALGAPRRLGGFAWLRELRLIGRRNLSRELVVVRERGSMFWP
mmetsp:Transcript_24889/g.75763  ORF Transcript_24889/g.75763 Transcript_24889/m.75763 type:complete len:338 (+) Transcript_24889:1257-2270(+)